MEKGLALETFSYTLVFTLRRFRRIHSPIHSSRRREATARTRALGSTTTKLFGNDYFRRYNYISMRLTIVESSATTRFFFYACG